MELKQNIGFVCKINVKRSNWTFMELKHSIFDTRRFEFGHDLIEPLWNWNLYSGVKMNKDY